MVKTLTLDADKNSLLLEIDREGWTKCILVDQRRVELGAEAISFIASRLLRWFREVNVPSSGPVGEINGLPVTCLLSLSELHHSLYGAIVGENRLLFWQNAQTVPPSLASVMTLFPEQCRQWQAQLQFVLAHEPASVSRPVAVTTAG